MILDIGRALSNPGVEFPFTLSASEMPAEDDDLPLEDVRLTGVMIGAGESVMVRGDLDAMVNAQCARCLKPLKVPMSAPFDEVYVREVDPEDPEKLAYTGSSLDLSEQVHAALVLNMPIRFLCREECPGLCPACGADLNQGPCSCQKELPQQHPFSALQSLLTKDEEV